MSALPGPQDILYAVNKTDGKAVAEAPVATQIKNQVATQSEDEEHSLGHAKDGVQMVYAPIDDRSGDQDAASALSEYLLTTYNDHQHRHRFGALLFDNLPPAGKEREFTQKVDLGPLGSVPVTF